MSKDSQLQDDCPHPEAVIDNKIEVSIKLDPLGAVYEMAGPVRITLEWMRCTKCGRTVSVDPCVLRLSDEFEVSDG